MKFPNRLFCGLSCEIGERITIEDLPTSGEAKRLGACLHAEVAVCDDAHSKQHSCDLISNKDAVRIRDQH